MTPAFKFEAAKSGHNPVYHIGSVRVTRSRLQYWVNEMRLNAKAKWTGMGIVLDVVAMHN